MNFMHLFKQIPYTSEGFKVVQEQMIKAGEIAKRKRLESKRNEYLSLAYTSAWLLFIATCIAIFAATHNGKMIPGYSIAFMFAFIAFYIARKSYTKRSEYRRLIEQNIMDALS